MAATNHKKLAKGKFEKVLCGKYREVQCNVVYENQHDDYDAHPVRLTLYYEVLPEQDEWGIVTRHCGTWTNGKCWEFLTKGE